MPMNTMSGFDSLTATAPTEADFTWPSVTGNQVEPPSIVFQSPPPTAPKYASCRRPFTPLAAIDRPPRSGPMLRHLKFERNAESSVTGSNPCCIVAGVAAVAPIAKARGRPRVTRGLVRDMGGLGV